MPLSFFFFKKKKMITVTLQTTGEQRQYNTSSVSLQQIAKDFKIVEKTGLPLLGIKANHLLRNTNEVLSYSKIVIEPVYFNSAQGHEMYRRTLAFLMSMAMAMENAFNPEYKENPLYITLEHHLGTGYYGLVHKAVEIKQLQSSADEDGDDQDVTDEATLRKLCSLLQLRIESLVKKNLQIVRKEITFEEAEEFFIKRRLPYSLSLLRSRNNPTYLVDACIDEETGFEHWQHHFRTTISHTSLISEFGLEYKQNGIVLKFPRDPFNLNYSDNMDILIKTMSVANHWGRQVRVECSGDLNKTITTPKEIKHLIALNHSLHDRRIGDIANVIASKRDSVRLILMAGPSSSGKTTFSKKLGMQLEMLGIKPVILSVDDYYKANADCPVDEDGSYNFEVLDALRLDLLNQHLKDLFEGKEIEAPLFDFHVGKPKAVGVKMRMPKNSVLLMEGIHCLNEAMSLSIPQEMKFKIFLAPFAQINLDEINFISNTVLFFSFL